jgi:signal transduction histidine kinase
VVWTVDAVVASVPPPGAAEDGLGWGALLLPNLLCNTVWVPITVLAVWLAVSRPITAGGRNAVVHLGGLAAAVLGRAVAMWAFNDLTGWYEVLPDWPQLLGDSIVNNVLTYVLVVGAAHAVYYAEVARVRERQFGQARLDALAAQIQPHFLFNSLNAIVASVHDRPDAAEAMIVDLAELLRYSLDHDRSVLIPLEEELEVTESYLGIERHRFADRLTVRWQVDPAARGAAVPPFLLQPLVENAVRHGLSCPSTGSVVLTIDARRIDGVVELRVEDDGAGPPADPLPGVGTSTTRERLRHIYGPSAGLTISPRAGGGTVALVRLPHRTAIPERSTA